MNALSTTSRAGLLRRPIKHGVRPRLATMAMMNSPIDVPDTTTLPAPTATPDFDMVKIRQEIFQYWMVEQAQSPQGLTSTARYCCFTHEDAQRAYRNSKSTWHWLDRELSSNLAGETGAVHIYKGALAAMNYLQRTTAKPSTYSLDALEFCQAHMANESCHLDYFESIIPSGKHTRLLPIWRMAGWALGFVPTLLGGPKALYVTVEAVETFVEEHFEEQITALLQNQKEQQQQSQCPELIKLLQHCCADEVHHREDAVQRLLDCDEDLTVWWVQPWTRIVKTGSAVAAAAARTV